MKVLVTGVKGLLGYDVMKVLKSRKIDCIGADLEQFDITDPEATGKFIKECHPDTVIHCSAFTAVDRAEEQLDLCRKVNAEGPRNIAKVCKELHAKMIYISTDYVFPGVGDHAYEPDDPTGPLSVYGETKLEGERRYKRCLTAILSFEFRGCSAKMETTLSRRCCACPIRTMKFQSFAIRSVLLLIQRT